MKVEGAELAAVIAGADAHGATFRPELHDRREAGTHRFGDSFFRQPVDNDFEDTADPPMEFATHHAQKMQEFVRWLKKQEPSAFEQLRQTGCVTEVSLFVVADVSEDAVDLALSSEFMGECVRLGLALSIMVSTP